MGSSNSIDRVKIRKDKNQERQKKIKEQLIIFERLSKQLGIDHNLIQKVTRAPLESQVQMLNQGKINSKQLTLIYCLRSATVGVTLNLITQTNFEDALRLAQQCDKIRQKTKNRNWTFNDKKQDELKLLPPLFGIPISIKDTFDIKGLSSTIGITHRAFQLKQSDGVIIKCLKNAGMIPFVKSNIPQLAMIYDSNNFLWGRALNPWNKKKTVGGSSGGEGGLIAARCSCIGLGSDIGGSIRIPSQFCGVYGLKSSCHRLSNNYQTDYSISFSGMDTLKVVIGPLSNSVQGLALWMKTATNQSYYKGQSDPYNKNIPFDDKIFHEFKQKKNLKIGYIKSLKFVQSSKASQRAVEQTISILKEIGHQLIPIQIPHQKQIIRAFFTQLSAEGNSETFRQMLKGQEFIQQYNQVNTLASMSRTTLNIVSWLYSKRSQQRISYLIDGSGKKSVFQYIKAAGMVYEYRKQWVNHWKKNNLDLLIMPGFGTQATTHGFSQKLGLTAAYTFIWNVLGMTVGSMPITLCRQEQQIYESQYNDQISEATRQSSVDSVGLPVGIQVISLPFQDEKVLGFMKNLSDKIKFNQKHPYPDY